MLALDILDIVPKAGTLHGAAVVELKRDEVVELVFAGIPNKLVEVIALVFAGIPNKLVLDAEVLGIELNSNELVGFV